VQQKQQQQMLMLMKMAAAEGGWVLAAPAPAWVLEGAVQG
jgi:hypothetical protein